MNDFEEIIQAIHIGVVVATFLYRTGRARKTIELCKEILVLLNNKALEKEKQFAKFLYEAIYKVLSVAYLGIRDYTNAIAYGRKLLAIERECRETVQEGILCINLATICQAQNKYFEAKELYERAISIMNKTGNKKYEAHACAGLGTVLHSLSEFAKSVGYLEKALAMAIEIGDRKTEESCYGNLGALFISLADYVKANEYLEKALAIAIEIGDRQGEGACYQNLGTVFHSLGDYVKANEYLEKALAIAIEIGNRKGEGSCYGNLGAVFISLGDYVKANEYLEKSLAIAIERGDRKGEGSCYGNLGALFISLGDYVKANEYLEKSLAIAIERGDRKGEGSCYGNLGTVFRSLGDYVKATEYLGKALAIAIEIGERKGEGSCYRHLGTVFHSLGDFAKANEYLEKALAIAIEIGNREGEGSCYQDLGTVFRSLGDYVKAKEYLEKALAIAIEIGDRKGEGSCYRNLGTVFKSLGDYVKANEYLEKALPIAIEIGDKEEEGSCYRKLGIVLLDRCDYVKAEEYLKKSLNIAIEIGDRGGEGSCNGILGTVFSDRCDYVKAKEYLEKSLSIVIEIGDREGEGSCNGILGNVFIYRGDYVKAKEYLEKSLSIAIEIGDRKEEGSCYRRLGTVFTSLGDYVKANEYLEKALGIAKEIGDRKVEGSCYGNLGIVFIALGDCVKANDYLEKALAITIVIGDRGGEAFSRQSLGVLLLFRGIKYADADKHFKEALLIATETGERGQEQTCFMFLGDLSVLLRNYVKAKEYYEKALAISVEIGDRTKETASYCKLGSLCLNLHEYGKAEEYLENALSIVKEGVKHFEVQIFTYEKIAKAKVPQDKTQEAFPYLFQAIQKCEECRGFLKDNDDFGVLYSDKCNSPYKTLSSLFCASGNPKIALYVEELRRARALSHLMAAQYSVEQQISADPQSWIGIQNVANLESDSTCLYISYDAQSVQLWILKASGVVEFQESTMEKETLRAKHAKNLNTYFNKVAESFRSFGILPPELCEDRSFNGIEPTPDSSEEDNLAALREQGREVDPRPNLTLFYKMIIAPVAKFLKGSEIIIVPDRQLYRVPFPALLDDSGKYLSETFRIRIVPSLTTLKCIQDSPADYHSQTGALIVGDPEVGEVVWKGCRKTISPLPCARKEAEMIGRLLGVQPLIGKQATKQAVLQRINSVSLIHFAAHGNEEKGEIILVPVGTGSRLPRETDCLLTVGDISQVQIRAKLVVLSCCHSGRGQIKVEGVVGMARAFLGSGARSVLVSLWALEDKATEQLMSRFYEHLYDGVSASESLHRAMKWMRDNGSAKVSEWAPFMLIGDNVTFDGFENTSKYKHSTLARE